MPKQTTETKPQRLAHQRPVRLYQEDDETLKKLHEEVGEKYGVDIVQFIRDSVHVGLPLICKRFVDDHTSSR